MILEKGRANIFIMRFHIRGNHLVVLLGVFIAFNLLFIDLLAVFIYTSVLNKLNALQLKIGTSAYDFFDQNEVLRKVVAAGKKGGFVSLTQETLGRVFSVSHSIPSHNNDTAFKTISFLGVDVSHSGEVLYIYKRILSRRSFPFANFVVDIGANDGFLSSNSLNFIQLGWDAVLVEPLSSQLALAKKNGKRFVDPYGDKLQNVHYEEAVIGDKDGFVEFFLSKDLTSMESFVMRDKKRLNTSLGIKVNVRSLSVKTLAEKYNVPKNFAVLSIDAEGVGDKVLHQWIDLGYRPAFIIYESMFNAESADSTHIFLNRFGYRHLAKLGWNHIYELNSLNGSGKH